MKRTMVITAMMCAAVMCAAVSAPLVAVQNKGLNPLLKEPLRLKQGLLSGVAGTNDSIAVYKGIPFEAPRSALPDVERPSPPPAGPASARQMRSRRAAFSPS